MARKEKSTSLKLEIVGNMSALVSAGLGLVAALAWNDAIQELFRQFFGTVNGLIAKFIYAALITILVVILTTRLSQAVNRLKRALEAEKK